MERLSRLAAAAETQGYSLDRLERLLGPAIVGTLFQFVLTMSIIAFRGSLLALVTAALLAFAASLSRRATRRNLRGRPKRRDAADRDRTRLRERPAHRPLPLAVPCAQS